MTRTPPPPLLSEIRDGESLSSRLAALRALKHEIIGHHQRKEAWVRWGILPLLSSILSCNIAESSNKFGPGTYQRPARQSLVRSGLTEQDEVCLQAIIILGSLAQGGPEYIAPIFAGSILPSLLSMLYSNETPRRLILEVLKTLHAIADRIPLGFQQNEAYIKYFASLFFAAETVRGLCRIIGQNCHEESAQLAIALTANLIAKTCVSEAHKIALAESGVLDALALKLASFVVAQGFVLPRPENSVTNSGSLDSLPSPAPTNARLAPILRAVATIIEYSKSRAQHLLTSPAIMTVFPRRQSPLPSADVKKPAWGPSYLAGIGTTRQDIPNPIDSVLPSVPSPPSKISANFPPLGHGGSYNKPGHVFISHPLTFSPDITATAAEDESPCISWLIYLVRAESGLTRLNAARLVTVLFRLGLAKKERVSMFGYLVVPLLVRMLDKDYEVLENNISVNGGLIPTTLQVKEEAPAVLAALILDSRELQRHAFEGGAIKKLSQLLKDSFSLTNDNEKPMWSATTSKESSPPSSSTEETNEFRLGQPGYPAMVVHKMKSRERVLQALAAIALFKEEYRKAVCDNGVVPYIIDSMRPCEPLTAERIKNSKAALLDGNPIPTLLAACAAARSLTRSVSVLRTSLIDAGVSTPVFALLKCHAIDVQIAATAVVCNLAMDFSPMKEAIIAANMIPTLCEHSHSSNVKLRLESIWALKHIAYNSTNDIKMKIVEELEPGWLKQVICQDPSDPAIRRKIEEDLNAVTSIRTATPLPPAEESFEMETAVVDNGVPREQVQSTENRWMPDPLTPPTRPTADGSMNVNTNARRRKLALNGDLDQTKQARRDDIQVQEQTLDLVRNLICGAGASEMIDYLFQEVGQNDLFDMLADKLRPKTLPGDSRRDLKSAPVPAEILCSVTYIMIHLGAGLSRHRQLLIQHRELLRLMIPLFNHSNKQVRVNCCWVVVNLTFEDDQSDHASCRERAVKLKNLGVMERLYSLEEDSEADVRERSKMGLHLMKTALGLN